MIYVKKNFAKTALRKLQKRGKTAAGTQRYFCPKCKQGTVRKHLDLSNLNHYSIYLEWLSGKLSLNEIGDKYRVTRQTLDNWFKPFRKNEVVPKYIDCSGKVLICDGYFIRFMATVLISQLSDNKVVSWLFTYNENYYTWLQLFNQIKDIPFAIVADGERGMIKAVKQRWPKIVIQRCQFHVIQRINTLTYQAPRNPNSDRFKSAS